jgi:hypothetical protein
MSMAEDSDLTDANLRDQLDCDTERKKAVPVVIRRMGKKFTEISNDQSDKTSRKRV